MYENIWYSSFCVRHRLVNIKIIAPTMLPQIKALHSEYLSHKYNISQYLLFTNVTVKDMVPGH